MEDGSSVVLYYVPNIKMFDVHCIQLLVIAQNAQKPQAGCEMSVVSEVASCAIQCHS